MDTKVEAGEGGGKEGASGWVASYVRGGLCRGWEWKERERGESGGCNAQVTGKRICARTGERIET